MTENNSRIKYDSTDRWAKIPEKLLNDTRVGVTELRAYAAIALHSPNPHPGIDRIAKIVRCHRTTAMRAVTLLEKLGWVVVHRKTGGVNHYEVYLDAVIGLINYQEPEIDPSLISTNDDTSRIHATGRKKEPVASRRDYHQSHLGATTPVASRRDPKRESKEINIKRKVISSTTASLEDVQIRSEGIELRMTIKEKQKLAQSYIQSMAQPAKLVAALQKAAVMVQEQAASDPLFAAWEKVVEAFHAIDPRRARASSARMQFDDKARKVLQTIIDLGYDLEAYAKFTFQRISKSKRTWFFTWKGFDYFLPEFDDEVNSNANAQQPTQAKEQSSQEDYLNSVYAVRAAMKAQKKQRA